ncbi:hypothetical protein [Klebsiella variicola]|uniref:hypothetical protein n=2 Tax=Klebsiella TaxID=570 RepID=UPI001C65F39B|nr:hypothetical protein [Klebsiella variicola]
MVKDSTAKIAFAYITDDLHEPEERVLAAKAHLFLPEGSDVINVILEFGLVGLNDDSYYTLFTRFYFKNEEVGFPDDKSIPHKFLNFFAKSGEFAIQGSSSERFVAKEAGYYKVESKLYEYDADICDQDDSVKFDEKNVVHQNNFYIAVASEWSE